MNPGSRARSFVSLAGRATLGTTLALALAGASTARAQGTAAPPPVAPAAAVTQAPAPDAVVPPGAPDPLESLLKPGDRVLLSDELSITRWAHPQDIGRIRATPSTSAPTVGRIRLLTEDAVAEVYVALEARVDAAGRTWLRIRVPKRPSGITGWVRDETLGELRVVRTRLVIDRRSLRASLYNQNTKVWTARVGIGKSGTPTPRGVFYIRERLRGGGGVYGPWAFGTSAYSALSDWPGGGVVGIHGTNQPGLIPGRPSHGCIRVRNDKIRQLARLMPNGTPVHII